MCSSFPFSSVGLVQESWWIISMHRNDLTRGDTHGFSFSKSLEISHPQSRHTIQTYKRWTKSFSFFIQKYSHCEDYLNQFHFTGSCTMAGFLFSWFPGFKRNRIFMWCISQEWLWFAKKRKEKIGGNVRPLGFTTAFGCEPQMTFDVQVDFSRLFLNSHKKNPD